MLEMVVMDERFEDRSEGDSLAISPFAVLSCLVFHSPESTLLYSNPLQFYLFTQVIWSCIYSLPNSLSAIVQ